MHQARDITPPGFGLIVYLVVCSRPLDKPVGKVRTVSETVLRAKTDPAFLRITWFRHALLMS